MTETCFQHQHAPGSATRQRHAKPLPQTQLAPNEGRHFSTSPAAAARSKARPGQGRCGAGGREGRACLQLQGPIRMRKTYTYAVLIELPRSHGAARSRKSKPDALHQKHKAFASLHPLGKQAYQNQTAYRRVQNKTKNNEGNHPNIRFLPPYFHADKSSQAICADYGKKGYRVSHMANKNTNKGYSKHKVGCRLSYFHNHFFSLPQCFCPHSK